MAIRRILCYNVAGKAGETQLAQKDITEKALVWYNDVFSDIVNSVTPISSPPSDDIFRSI